RDFRDRLRNHEPEALSTFFDGYFDWVFIRVHHRIRNRQIAEDLTQDIFLKIHKGLPRFDTSKDLKPWVLTILKTTCVITGAPKAREGPSKASKRSAIHFRA
ncbi:MAG: sigma factor, partial [Planctomycetota bacterium]|nr:sigma factor [Planctomycetota bacterium]